MIEWKEKIRPDKEAHKHNGEALTLIYLFIGNQLLVDDGWMLDSYMAGVVALTVHTSKMKQERKKNCAKLHLSHEIYSGIKSIC